MEKGPPGQTDPSQSRPAPQGSPDWLSAYCGCRPETTAPDGARTERRPPMAQRSRMRSVPDEIPDEIPNEIEDTPDEQDLMIDLAAVEGPLVTPGFSPLADFANFGEAEALLLRDAGPDIG